VDFHHIRCNLKDSTKDFEFSDTAASRLGHLAEEGLITDYKLIRKFYFGLADSISLSHTPGSSESSFMEPLAY
jgi:hypothetical protein